MKIILLKKIEKLGEKLEIKNVKSGYARNFLIPKKMAIPASKNGLKWREIEIKIENKKEKERKDELQKTVEKINRTKLKITAKSGLKGELFEKITENKILKILKKNGIEIKKENINLKEPIEKIGEYEVLINLNKGTKTKIKIIVEAESNK